ncbi:hypothetical protein ALC53_00279 [Atta colombica]|uniref:Uncharacterized protein n=1 Tax=Atta colombica TaxID=520822 RepID=A0A195BXM5_9HYME|nr:hypothetical protein ALC53_00279 [Atta colombica]
MWKEEKEGKGERRLAKMADLRGAAAAVLHRCQACIRTVLKESMIERNEQLSELENLFSYLEEHRSLKGYNALKTSRSSALLSKNGTSVGESDTTACASRPDAHTYPPILFAYLLAYLRFPACIRVGSLLCTDYKVDIGCTSCILYDLCRSADGPSLQLSVSSAGELHFCNDGLTNLPPTTFPPSLPNFFYDAEHRRGEARTSNCRQNNMQVVAAGKHRLRN